MRSNKLKESADIHDALEYWTIFWSLLGPWADDQRGMGVGLYCFHPVHTYPVGKTEDFLRLFSSTCDGTLDTETPQICPGVHEGGH